MTHRWWRVTRACDEKSTEWSELCMDNTHFRRRLLSIRVFSSDGHYGLIVSLHEWIPSHHVIFQKRQGEIFSYYRILTSIRCNKVQNNSVHGGQTALNFRKFKVALNSMYRIYLNFAKSYILSCLSKFPLIRKKFHRAVFEIIMSA